MPTDLPNLLTLSRIAAIPRAGGVGRDRAQPWADMAACVVFARRRHHRLFRRQDRARPRQHLRLRPDAGPDRRQAAGRRRADAAGRARPALARRRCYPAIVIMLREILVSGLREYLAELRVGLPVTRLAKWKTGFQMGALGTLLAGDTRRRRCIGLGFLPVSLIGEVDALDRRGADPGDRLGLPAGRAAPCRARGCRRGREPRAPGRDRRRSP